MNKSKQKPEHVKISEHEICITNMSNLYLNRYSTSIQDGTVSAAHVPSHQKKNSFSYYFYYYFFNQDLENSL